MAFGEAISVLFGGGKKVQPYSPPPLPKAPTPEAAQDKSQDQVRRKRAAASKSVYTSPLGVGGQANIAKKTLLGQ